MGELLHDVEFFGFVLKTFGCIIFIFDTGKLGAQRMNPSDFGESRTFPLSTPAKSFTYPMNYLNIYLIDVLFVILYIHGHLKMYPKNNKFIIFLAGTQQ